MGWLMTAGLGSENPLAHVEYVYGTVFAFTRYTRVHVVKLMSIVQGRLSRTIKAKLNYAS